MAIDTAIGFRPSEPESAAQIQQRLLAAIREGLADSDAGRLVPHDEVVARMRTKFGDPKPRR